MPAVVTESPLSNVHHIRATLRLTAAGCQLDTATLSDRLLTRFLCEWRSYFFDASCSDVVRCCECSVWSTVIG